MTAQLMMVQAIAQNIALFCCAIFTGGSIYVSLVEDPATAEGGVELAGTYLLSAHPRPAIVQTLFAAIAALAGVLAGLAGNGIWWVVGGAILGVAALWQLFVVNPTARRLREVNPAADAKRANKLLARLTRLHAGLSLAGLAALFIFIMKT
jgi:hypothetical protein